MFFPSSHFIVTSWRAAEVGRYLAFDSAVIGSSNRTTRLGNLEINWFLARRLTKK